MVLLVRKQHEGLLEFLVLVALGHLGHHDVGEGFEVNRDFAFFLAVEGVAGPGSRLLKVLDQTLDFLLGGFEAKSTQRYLQVLKVDLAGASGVKQIKGLFDLFLLLGRELLAESAPDLGLLLALVEERGLALLVVAPFLDAHGLHIVLSLLQKLVSQSGLKLWWFRGNGNQKVHLPFQFKIFKQN